MSGLRVAGHGLRYEGRPVLEAGCCTSGGLNNHGRRNPYDRHGHGLCSCGAMSAHHESNGARRRWHREHKAEVLRCRVLDAAS